jgi:hypothetical protein
MAIVEKSRTDKVAFDDRQLILKVRNRLLKAYATKSVTRDANFRSKTQPKAWAGPSLPFLYRG